MEMENSYIIEPEASPRMIIPEVRPLSKGLLVTAFLSTWISVGLGIIAAVLLISAIAENDGFREISNIVQEEYSLDTTELEDGDGEEDINIQIAGGDVLGVHNSASVTTNKEISTDLISAIVLIVLSVMGFVAATLFTIVIYMLVLHRGWQCFQALRIISPGAVLDMPTAGESVGLMFVPTYNLYWIFPAYMGLEKYGTLMAGVRGLSYTGPTRSFAKTMCILTIISLLAPPLIIVVLVMLFLLMLRTNEMVNVLGKSFAIERS